MIFLCKKRISTDEIITYTELLVLYYKANGFKKAFEILKSSLLAPHTLETDNLFTITPIVNGMLSMELYFKFIYGLERCNVLNKNNVKIKHIHRTNSLFKKLNRATQQKIENMVNDRGIPPDIFKKFIKKHSNDFVTWRYPTKKPSSSDINIIEKILISLYEYSKNLVQAEYKYEYYIQSEIKEYSITII